MNKKKKQKNCLAYLDKLLYVVTVHQLSSHHRIFRLFVPTTYFRKKKSDKFEHLIFFPFLLSSSMWQLPRVEVERNSEKDKCSCQEPRLGVIHTSPSSSENLEPRGREGGDNSCTLGSLPRLFWSDRKRIVSIHKVAWGEEREKRDNGWCGGVGILCICLSDGRLVARLSREGGRGGRCSCDFNPFIIP